MEPLDADSIKRFTPTVQQYLKYRPHYPKEIIFFLRDEYGLKPHQMIADVGSGTGFLAELFLNYGNTVYGIEPNDAMREAGEKYLKGYLYFHSVKGKAEATTLLNQSMDFVVVGTAFHWFDPMKAKTEFQRILKPPSLVALIWNVRDLGDLFIQAYENLMIKYGKNYQGSRAKIFENTVPSDFFVADSLQVISIPHAQYFTWEGLVGRMLSTSYSLRDGDSGYAQLLSDLKLLFNQYQDQGLIKFSYHTKAYAGSIRP